jgi:hypothetical protein
MNKRQVAFLLDDGDNTFHQDVCELPDYILVLSYSETVVFLDTAART